MSQQEAARVGRGLLPATTAAPWFGGLRQTAWLAPALGYAVTALALRWVLFGNPVVHIDEQFYLLVGDRMLHGAVPFVDMWDRKPIGLFLIYAAASWLGGGGVLAYQLLACASASLTALTIHMLARTIAPARGAWLAGLGYLLFLMLFNCTGGQSPVFYNLPVALCVLWLVKIASRNDSARLVWHGTGLMLLAGLALQIKYTVVFEAACFGGVLLCRAFADGASYRRMLALAALWIAAAWLPTALALGWFAAMGHAHEFIQANFISIFYRNQPAGPALFRLAKEMLVLAPFWLAIFGTVRRLPAADGRYSAARSVLTLWALAAVGGFLVFGSWFDHYVAPILPPLAVLAAPAFGSDGRGRLATWLMLAVGGIGTIAVVTVNLHQRGNAEEVETASALITSHLGGRCLYVFEAEPVLYRTTNACILSRFVFPSHLSSTVEADALGVDQARELNRIMTARPGVVVYSAKPIHTPANLQTRAILQAYLAANYTAYATVPIGQNRFTLYQLRDLTQRQAAR